MALKPALVLNVRLRIIILTCLLSASCAILNAQNRYFQSGIISGFHKYTLSGDINDFWNAVDGIGFNYGTMAGLYAKHALSYEQYVKCKIRYIRKGSIHTLPSYYGLPNYERLKLDYLEILLVYGKEIFVYQKRCYLEIGPGVARLARKRMFIDQYNSYTDISYGEAFRNFDVTGFLELVIPAGRKEKLAYTIEMSTSLFSIHKMFKLQNFHYGFGLDYQF